MVVNPITKGLFKRFEHTFSTVARRIVETVLSKLPGRAEITNSMEKVKVCLTTLNESLMRVRKNAHTKDVEKANEQRGTYFRSLVLRLESDILWDFDPKIQQNAIKLYTILEEIGKTLKKAQSDQSNQLELLTSRFDEQKAIIDENGYTQLYDNFKKADKQFRDSLALSTESTATKKEIPWLSVAFDDLVESLNVDLFKRLDINTEDNADKELFIEVVTILNKIIDEAHKIQRARIARGETEDTPPDDDSDDKPAKAEKPQEDQLEKESTTA